MDLTGSQRQRLRGLAHALKPLVQIGKKGLTAQVTGEIDLALEAHELIKVRFADLRESKKDLCLEIESRTHSHNVGIVGHNAIFFRQHPDPEKRRINPGTGRGQPAG